MQTTNDCPAPRARRRFRAMQILIVEDGVVRDEAEAP